MYNLKTILSLRQMMNYWRDYKSSVRRLWKTTASVFTQTSFFYLFIGCSINWWYIIQMMDPLIAFPRDLWASTFLFRPPPHLREMPRSSHSLTAIDVSSMNDCYSSLKCTICDTHSTPVSHSVAINPSNTIYTFHVRIEECDTASRSRFYQIGM